MIVASYRETLLDVRDDEKLIHKLCNVAAMSNPTDGEIWLSWFRRLSHNVS